MKIFKIDIEKATLENTYYRKVSCTGKYLQVVLMSIPPNDFIDLEVHETHDQFIRIEAGNGKAYEGKQGKKSILLKNGTAIVVPAGTWHKIVNTSKTKPLKLYTVYGPPNHPANRKQKTHPKND